MANSLPGGGWGIANPQTTTAAVSGTRSWLSNVLAGEVAAATETVGIAGRAGQLNVVARAGILAADGAAAVAACVVSNVVCAAGAAAVAYGAYRYYRPDKVPGSVNPTADFDYDPGKATTAQTQYCTTAAFSGGPACSPTLSGLASAVAAKWQWGQCGDGSPAPRYSFAMEGTGGGTVVGRYTGACPGYSVTVGAVAWQSGNQSSQAQVCKGEIDFSDSRYSVPDGMPVGPDGKCPTARYSHQPVTAAAAAAGLLAAGGATAPKLGPGVQEAVANSPAGVPATITTSGPASQTGTPTTTTTTGPTGTVTDTRTPTYTYQYSGNQVTYNTTYVTVNNQGGNTTTTTITPPAPTPQDPTDPCTSNPGRIGCQDTGTPVDQPALYTKKPDTVSGVMSTFRADVNAAPFMAKVGSFFTVAGLGGQCPTWTANIPYINYTLVIDFLCWDATILALGIAAIVMKISAAYAAFRVAIL